MIYKFIIFLDDASSWSHSLWCFKQNMLIIIRCIGIMLCIDIILEATLLITVGCNYTC